MITTLAVVPVLAVIVLLKGQDEPIRGYFVRENEHDVGMLAKVLRECRPGQNKCHNNGDDDDIVRHAW